MAEQIESSIAAARKDNANFGMLWIEVKDQWGTSGGTINQSLLGVAVSTAKSAGVKVGIITNFSRWWPLFGKYDGVKDLPLWYISQSISKGNTMASDDNIFGGWEKPAIRQGRESFNECGLSSSVVSYIL